MNICLYSAVFFTFFACAAPTEQNGGLAASLEASLKPLEKESDVPFGYSLVIAVKDNDDKDSEEKNEDDKKHKGHKDKDKEKGKKAEGDNDAEEDDDKKNSRKKENDGDDDDEDDDEEATPKPTKKPKKTSKPTKKPNSRKRNTPKPTKKNDSATRKNLPPCQVRGTNYRRCDTNKMKSRDHATCRQIDNELCNQQKRKMNRSDLSYCECIGLGPRSAEGEVLVDVVGRLRGFMGM